jgi:tetratricopeptide (TPR) repeat protein
VGLCQEADVPVWLPMVAAPLGAAYTLSGCVTDAVPLLAQAIEQSTATERVDFQAFCLLSLGEAHLLAGRLEEAYPPAERALAFAGAHQERGHQAYALRLLGEIAARREPPECDQAKACYRQARALAQELGMRPLVAHCHLGVGKLYRRTGDRARADEHLQTALTMYREMDMGFWLEKAEDLAAGLLEAPPEGRLGRPGVVDQQDAGASSDVRVDD